MKIHPLEIDTHPPDEQFDDISTLLDSGTPQFPHVFQSFRQSLVKGIQRCYFLDFQSEVDELLILSERHQFCLKFLHG